MASVNGADTDDDGLGERAAALEGELLHRGEAPGAAGGSSGADPGAEEFVVDPVDMVADTLEFVGAWLAPYWFDAELPEHVRITREKTEKVAKGYVLLGAKYLPGLMDRFPLEFSVLLQTAMVVAPLLKAGVPRHKPKPKAEKPADAPTTGAG